MNARVAAEGPFLGNLCKRGHDHEGTGHSLRDRKGACIECDRGSRANARRVFNERQARLRKAYEDRVGTEPVPDAPVNDVPYHRERTRDPHWVPSEGPLTLEEIAIRMGVSRERVRQIENDALRKLRRRFGRALLEHLFSTVDPQARGVRR